MAATKVLFLLVVCIISVFGEEDDLDVAKTLRDQYELSPPYYGSTIKPVTNYILPILKWSLGLLEPFIDRATVEAHFYGHHNAYRMKLNAALKEWREEFPEDSFARESLVTILEDLDRVPEKYYTAIVNNAGGYVNHALYWGCLMPNLVETGQNATAREPEGALREEIEEVFGSYEAFREEFTKQALAKFGSGYVWLVRKPKMERRQLFIVQSDNQDCPLSVGEKPLLVIDIWEHAYYLKHQYRRANHIEDWWMLVDWTLVAELDEFWKNDMKLGEKYQWTEPTRPLEVEVPATEEKKEEL